MLLPLLWAASTWMSPFVPLYQMDRPAVDSLLSGERWQALAQEEKLCFLAVLRSGTPYALGCLGEEEEPDPDPIFRLDRADCTVLVITNAALLHARSLSEAERTARQVHYKGGEPSYSRRYHFTTDRILRSAYFAEITGRVAPDSLLERVSVILNRKESGEPLLDLDWEREVTVRYLPSERLDESILDRLPAACGVAFVDSGNVKNGFLVSHEGIVIDRRVLHHASSAAGRVVETDLVTYLLEEREEPRFDGVLFYRFR